MSVIGPSTGLSVSVARSGGSSGGSSGGGGSGGSSSSSSSRVLVVVVAAVAVVVVAVVAVVVEVVIINYYKTQTQPNKIGTLHVKSMIYFNNWVYVVFRVYINISHISLILLSINKINVLLQYAMKTYKSIHVYS